MLSKVFVLIGASAFILETIGFTRFTEPVSKKLKERRRIKKPRRVPSDFERLLAFNGVDTSLISDSVIKTLG